MEQKNGERETNGSVANNYRRSVDGGPEGRQGVGFLLDCPCSRNAIVQKHLSIAKTIKEKHFFYVSLLRLQHRAVDVRHNLKAICAHRRRGSEWATIFGGIG